MSTQLAGVVTLLSQQTCMVPRSFSSKVPPAAVQSAESVRFVKQPGKLDASGHEPGTTSLHRAGLKQYSVVRHGVPTHDTFARLVVASASQLQ